MESRLTLSRYLVRLFVFPFLLIGWWFYFWYYGVPAAIGTVARESEAWEDKTVLWTIIILQMIFKMFFLPVLFGVLTDTFAVGAVTFPFTANAALFASLGGALCGDYEWHLKHVLGLLRIPRPAGSVSKLTDVDPEVVQAMFELDREFPGVKEDKE
jgi:hypothetical protein